MDAEDWNARYAASEQVWSEQANRWVVEMVEPLPPGRAVDLAAGEGRNALWLAARGWQTTAVDFSEVALARGRSRPGGQVLRWVRSDVVDYRPDELVDLVVVCYLHLEREAMRLLLARTTEWLAPGGSLVVVGHALRNLIDGVGGPQDPQRLQDVDLYRGVATGLDVRRCEEVARPVGERMAIDVVLHATRSLG